MPTIWGCLDRVDRDLRGARWIQVKTVVSGSTTIRVRALVGNQTLVVRGIEQIDLFNLCAGEFVEVSYRHSRDGFMEADTIYVQPERVPAA